MDTLVPLSSFDPGDLPDFTFVKRIRQPGQSFPNQKKEKPCNHNAGRTLQNADHAGKSAACSGGRPGQFPEACRTQHTVIMLGDALPAEIEPAFRASRNSLSHGVIGATLIGKAAHIFNWTRPDR